ncbi:L,D-transpeptidase family protein [Streptomyces rubellomurinus]|uniref:L,D-transpeptidase family protein n=1 Tax=Streptomyces rubellomurinus (strain ATCC 31215) TaxID=359131 RepID=UPI000ABAF8CF|nr:L,D-transpeptidase family protein [Streptomyces rubellomurinus]
MSGSHRATTYPPYEPIPEPVYEVPQPSYDSYDGYQQQGWYDGQQQYPQAADGYYEVYEQPSQQFQQFQPYADQAEPEYQPEPYAHAYQPEAEYQTEPEYQTAPESYAYEYRPEPEPVAEPVPEAAVAAPEGSRSAARGRRRKAKPKRHGKAVMAGTALLVAAAAGWYTVGQDDARPALTAADGPGPDASRPDQPAPTPAPAAVQAAADRQAQPATATRGEARADASVAAIPGLGPSFTAKIPAETTQVLVASGQDKNTDKNTVVLWTRTPEGRWLAGETWQGHNGKNGWTTDHNQGDLRSPVGVFSLTDAGGRKDNPGSKLPYDKDPSFVVSGTGFFGDQLAGSFDYVVAINYNRVAGSSPLDMRRPMGAGKGGGIWLHVDHDGPTHGCVSIPEDKMAQLIRTLDPAAHPVVVMGDAAALAA